MKDRSTSCLIASLLFATLIGYFSPVLGQEIDMNAVNSTAQFFMNALNRPRDIARDQQNLADQRAHEIRLLRMRINAQTEIGSLKRMLLRQTEQCMSELDRQSVSYTKELENFLDDFTPLIEELIYWLSDAAERGNVDAQYRLGVINIGSGNYEEAVIWLKEAIEQGHTKAEQKLSLAYTLSSGK